MTAVSPTARLVGSGVSSVNVTSGCVAAIAGVPAGTTNAAASPQAASTPSRRALQRGMRPPVPGAPWRLRRCRDEMGEGLVRMLLLLVVRVGAQQTHHARGLPD